MMNEEAGGVIASDVGEESGTGLEPEFAGALAYLAGPFSGAIILLAERSNRFVRFHAWQAIIGLGGIALFGFLLLLFAFAGLFISPTAFTFFFRMAGVTLLAWLVVWALCLFKAFGGAAWKMPFAGDRAARRALRI